MLSSGTIADSFRAEACFCANAREIGYVLPIHWQADALNGNWTWYKWYTEPRNDQVMGTVGERCDTDGCHTIPNLGSSTKLTNVLYPNGRKEKLAGLGKIWYNIHPQGAGSIESGNHRYTFSKEEVHTSTVMDCRDVCRNKWQPLSPFGEAYDACTYTDPKRGRAIPAGMKLDKKGNLVESLKTLGRSFQNCWLFDVPNFKSNLDKRSTVRGLRYA